MALKEQLSKYKVEYDEEIVKLAKEGLNFYLIAAKWNLCRDTLYEWCDRYPSFFRAYARAKTIRAGLLLEKTECGMGNRDFNANAAKLVLDQEEDLSTKRRAKIANLEKGTLTDKANRVLEEVGKGDLAIDDGLTLTQTIATATKIEEITNVREELRSIKELLPKKK